MSAPRHLLIVFHSRSGATEALARAVIDGAASAAESVELRVRGAFEAGSDDLRWCHAVILGTPENFGYMSGALKDFFDRVFYEIGDDTQGLPWALFIKAGNDGAGAVTAVERIVTGLRWREIQPPLVITGEVRAEDLERCRELGAAFAAALDLGMF